MPFPRSSWLFPLTLCLLVTAPAGAQTGFAPAVSIQRERVQLTVNADGTYREFAEQSVRIRTARA